MSLDAARHWAEAWKGESLDDAMVVCYWRIKRKPEEGTMAAAIRVHAQACGVVAYLFNVHPDEVARAVAQ